MVTSLRKRQGTRGSCDSGVETGSVEESRVGFSTEEALWEGLEGYPSDPGVSEESVGTK